MAHVVHLGLTDVRRIRFGKARDLVATQKVKAAVEEWLRDGVTLSVADARGQVEDISPGQVDGVEVSEEDTTFKLPPSTGM